MNEASRNRRPGQPCKKKSAQRDTVPELPPAELRKTAVEISPVRVPGVDLAAAEDEAEVPEKP